MSAQVPAKLLPLLSFEEFDEAITALHEAGHCVVLHHFGLRFKCVAIHPKAAVWLGYPRPMSDRWHYAVADLGGDAAVTLVTGHRDGFATQDHEDAGRALRGSEVLLERAFASAMDILKSHRMALEAVVARLLERKELCFKEVEHIINTIPRS